MKKLFVLVLLSSYGTFLCQKNIFTSTIQIVYGLDFKSDSTQAKKNNEIVCLYIGDNQSVFQDEKRYKVDSIIASQKYTQLPSKPMFKVNHVIFKDFKKSEIIFSEMVDKVVFGYKEPLNQMKWKLGTEKKNILTYECYKAETTFRGRQYTAWYTKTIPISDGPYKFAGLPGLILEVYDDKDHFHYKLLQIINKPKKIVYNSDIHFTDRKKLLESKMSNIQRNSKVEIKFNPMERE